MSIFPKELTILLHRTSTSQYFLRDFNDFASPGQLRWPQMASDGLRRPQSCVFWECRFVDDWPVSPGSQLAHSVRLAKPSRSGQPAWPSQSHRLVLLPIPFVAPLFRFRFRFRIWFNFRCWFRFHFWFRFWFRSRFLGTCVCTGTYDRIQPRSRPKSAKIDHSETLSRPACKLTVSMHVAVDHSWCLIGHTKML